MSFGVSQIHSDATQNVTCVLKTNQALNVAFVTMETTLSNRRRSVRDRRKLARCYVGWSGGEVEVGWGVFINNAYINVTKCARTPCVGIVHEI